MVDRLVLHIGLPKTGSLAIQRSLVRASESLLAAGTLYPHAGRTGKGQHSLFADQFESSRGGLSDMPSHIELLDEVRVTRPNALVLSSEFFVSLRRTRVPDWAVSLCRDLQTQHVQVLAYVRPQWDYLASAYAQAVRTGSAWMPFEEYLEGKMTNPRFDYPKVLGRWRRAFGDQVEIRPFAPDALIGSDAVRDFWDIAGLGSPPEPGSHHLNRRAGARTTEMLRALRERLADHDLDERVPIRRILREAQRRIEDSHPDDERFSPLTAALVQRIAETFSGSNQEFVSDYLGGSHAELFRPPHHFPEKPSTWSLSEASQAERELFDELVEDALQASRPSPKPVATGPRER